MRIDVFLQSEIETKTKVRLSRAYIERILLSGLVKYNNEIVKKKGVTVSNTKAVDIDWKRVDAVIEEYQNGVTRDNEAFEWSKSNVPADMTIDLTLVEKADDIKPLIILEDEDILAINKPPGVLSHPAPGDKTTPSAIYMFMKYMKNTYNYIPRGGLLHRIDKDTSGILLFAKNMQTYNEIKTLFEIRHIDKIYIAKCSKTVRINNLVRRNRAEVKKKFNQEQISKIIEEKVKDPIKFFANVQELPFFELNGWIGPSRKGTAMIFSLNKKEIKAKIIKNCFSEVCIIDEDESTYSALFILHTGRTHQIRAQAKYLGIPVVNDSLYGERRRRGRLELVHTAIRFTISKKIYNICI